MLHTDGIDDQRHWVRNERIFFASSLNPNYVTAGEQRWIVWILTGFGNTRAVYETSTVSYTSARERAKSPIPATTKPEMNFSFRDIRYSDLPISGYAVNFYGPTVTYEETGKLTEQSLDALPTKNTSD